MNTRVVIVIVAAAAALLPYPAGTVERAYSRGAYPRVQSLATSLSNAAPVALLDLALGALLLLALVAFIRGSRSHGAVRSAGRLAVRFVTVAAIVYLLFLATWGLNYRREPLDAKLDFDQSRISHEGAMRLAAVSAERLNTGYAAAHAGSLRTADLEASLREVHARLSGSHLEVMARPKASLLQLYFRQAAIDGMTVPVFLEIILNPDLLPVELPSTLAHEQAHIAGYADESEANFVSWLACVRSGDPLAEYSAWLDSYRLAVNALPRTARSALPRLEQGPRDDMAAIAERYARASPRVRNAARGLYDSYLKANRVEEGIDSYGVVLQLLLGTAFDEGWTPRLR